MGEDLDPIARDLAGAHMERIGRDRFKLTTGREFGAHQGIIGLQVDAPSGVYGGYDEQIFLESSDDEEPAWTIEERAELADYMIARWTLWRGPPP